MSTYQPNIPTGLVSFNQDYLNVQGNFQQLDTSFGDDHFAFSDQTSNNGYHKTIHMVNNSDVVSNPPNNYPPTAVATVANSGELFVTESNDGFNTDSTLWWQTENGRLVQMTSNLTPSKASNGYTFLPGGLIMQWGTNPAIADSNGTINYPIAFANNVFNVTFALQVSAGSTTSNAGQVYVRGNLSDLTLFNFRLANISATNTAFYWSAIGN